MRALLAACSDDRCAHATWSTYPKVPDSLSIVPSCQVFPGEIASKEAHGLSSSNTLVPLWAMMSIHRKSRSDPMNAAFGSIHKAAANLLRKGIPAKEVFGAHPDIAALLSEKGHKNASLLSRWAASMVHSTRNKGFPLNFSIPLLQILTWMQVTTSLALLVCMYYGISCDGWSRHLNGRTKPYQNGSDQRRLFPCTIPKAITDLLHTDRINFSYRTSTYWTWSYGRNSESLLFQRPGCKKEWSGFWTTSMLM